MRRYILFIVFIVSVGSANSQTAIYYRYYDIQGIDALSSHAKMVLSSDNNFYYMAFVEEHYSEDSSRQYTEVIFSKLTIDGTIVWTREISDSVDDAQYSEVSACAMPNDGLLVSFSREAGGIGIIVLEIDENGNITHNYSNNKVDNFSNIMMHDGYPYLVFSDYRNYAFELIKFDLNLNPLWTTDFDFNSNNGFVDYEYGMVTSNNDLLLVGNGRNYTVVVLDCNENGDLNWVKGYNVASNGSSDSLHNSPQTSFSIYSGLEDINHNIVFVGTEGTLDAIIMKITSTGDPLFCSHFGGASFDEAYDILPEGSSHYMIVAEPESFTTPYHSMMALSQFDFEGNLDWMNIYGDTAVGTFPYCGVQNPDSTYSVFGINGHFGEVKDIFLMKLSPTGQSACESISVSPFDSSIILNDTDISCTVVPITHDSIEVFNPIALTISTFTLCDSIITLDTINNTVLNSGQIFLPNAFTPGNETNGYFHLLGNGQVSSLLINIYNRWGQLIFTSNDPNFKWDGTFNGKPQPLDTYVWWMEYRLINNNRQQILKGNLTLLR